jgi:hypothetical protein
MIKKSSLAPFMSMAGLLDRGACPYMAIQVFPGKPPAFYRSSPVSFVQSKGFSPRNTANRQFVSFSHFQDCLKASADSIEVSVDASGTVCIESIDGPYRNFLQVHTTEESHTGMKYHALGDPEKEVLNPLAFSGLNIHPIGIVQEPTIAAGRLYLSTMAGIVKWQLPDSMIGIAKNPRISFLKFACGGKVETLSISENGYWVAHRDGVVGGFFSHSQADTIRQTFDVPSIVVAVLNASRLMEVLRNALELCKTINRIDIGPERGVTYRDKLGHKAAYSLGEFPSGAWNQFSISKSGVELILSALSQSTENEIVLQTIVPTTGGPARRMTRGKFEVDVRIMP